MLKTRTYPFLFFLLVLFDLVDHLVEKCLSDGAPPHIPLWVRLLDMFHICHHGVFQSVLPSPSGRPGECWDSSPDGGNPFGYEGRPGWLLFSRLLVGFLSFDWRCFATCRSSRCPFLLLRGIMNITFISLSKRIFFVWKWKMAILIHNSMKNTKCSSAIFCENINTSTPMLWTEKHLLKTDPSEQHISINFTMEMSPS